MRELKLVELVPLWKQGNGDMRSSDLMDDRVQDLVSMMQEGPVRLYLKQVQTKRSERSPDAVLLMLPKGKP
jgi:hypothetical protein